MLTASNLPAGIDWRLGEWQREMRDVKGDMLLARCGAPRARARHRRTANPRRRPPRRRPQAR